MCQTVRTELHFLSIEQFIIVSSVRLRETHCSVLQHFPASAYLSSERDACRRQVAPPNTVYLISLNQRYSASHCLRHLIRLRLVLILPQVNAIGRSADRNFIRTKNRTRRADALPLAETSKPRRTPSRNIPLRFPYPSMCPELLAGAAGRI